MAELHSWSEPIDDIEAMVRAAGDYVQASDDLRPRVLETARLECGERRAQRRIRRMALLFVLLAMFAPSNLGPVEAGGDRAWNRTESVANRDGSDVAWGLVEAFTELRRRQAEVFRPGR